MSQAIVQGGRRAGGNAHGCGLRYAERVQQGDSPYAQFNAQVAGKIQEAFEGWMAVAAGEPDAVARAIEHAITAGRPRTRYPITAAARTMMFLRRWLPDRAFDAFLRTQYTPPRPA